MLYYIISYCTRRVIIYHHCNVINKKIGMLINKFNLYLLFFYLDCNFINQNLCEDFLQNRWLKLQQKYLKQITLQKHLINVIEYAITVLLIDSVGKSSKVSLSVSLSVSQQYKFWFEGNIIAERVKMTLK